MDDPMAPGTPLAENPDGVLAVTTLAALGALYTVGVGVWNLATQGTPEGVALVLAGYLTLGVLIGFWRGTVWGYVGTVAVAVGALIAFWAAGEVVGAAVAAGVFGYLTAIPELYLGGSVEAAGGAG